MEAQERIVEGRLAMGQGTALEAVLPNAVRKGVRTVFCVKDGRYGGISWLSFGVIYLALVMDAIFYVVHVRKAGFLCPTYFNI